MKPMSPIRKSPFLFFIFTLFLVQLWAGAGSAAAPEGRVGSPERLRDVRAVKKETLSDGTGIRLTGNSFFSERELLRAAAEELAGLEKVPHLSAVADDAAFQMEMKYRQAGYAFASVGYRTEDHEPQGRTVTFVVEEGPRVTTRHIRFSGNLSQSEEKLLAFLQENGKGLSPAAGRVFVESVLLDGIANLKEFYFTMGYQDVEVSEPRLNFSSDRTLVDIALEITEGTRYIVAGIELAGEVLSGVEDQLADLKERLGGQPYFPRRKLELRSSVAEAYANQGYAEVQVEVAAREGEKKGEVILVAQIESGRRIIISRLVFAGNRKTGESFLRSRVKFVPGEIYSLERKRQSFQELYRTGLFAKIDMELLPEDEPDERALQVVVDEYPSKEVYTEIGWGSYEYLRMRAGFGENNLFGTGRIVRAEAGVSFKSEDFLLKLTDPWFLGTDITADLPVFYRRREEPAYKRKDSGGSLLFSREFANDLNLSAGYQFKRTSLTDIEVQSAIAELDNNYNLGTAKFQIALDTRDDIFMPTSGYRIFFSEEYSDKLLGSDIQYLRSSGGLRYFFSLRPNLVLGARFDTGLLLPLGNQVELPLSERYYNGGENTVRSFRQDRLGPIDFSGDPVGGMAYNILSMELRRKMTGNFSMSFFVDAGNIAPNESRSNQGGLSFSSRSELVEATFSEYFSDFRTGVGLGLQYLLPVGPARLDVAFNPDRKPERDEREYVIHFSIGMAF